MSELPPIRFKETPPWQHQRLVEWIGEWTLDLKLRTLAGHELSESAACEGVSSIEPADGLTGAFDRPVSIGQIRLLSPRLVPDADRPVYVAVFGDWDDYRVLLAPFSRFATPATLGEWATGRSTPPVLRVLAVWNSRVVPIAVLEESWLVDELTQGECAAAWAVFEQVTAGESLPEWIAQDVGPPVHHPQDPRLRYQAEESALFSRLDELCDAWDLPPLRQDPRVIPTIGFVQDPRFTSWRNDRFRSMRRQFANLAGDVQRVFCVLWEGDLPALQRSISGGELAGGYDFTATTLIEPQEDLDDPGKCLARWRIEDTEAMRRLRDGHVFYVIRGEKTDDSSRPIGRGLVRRIGGDVFAVLEAGWWSDFCGAENLTLLFPGGAS